MVTGVSSFVGCHLARAFAGQGWSVAATGTQPFNSYEGIRAERMKWIKDSVSSWSILDLRDEKAVRTFISQSRPRLWIHHAGHAVNYGSPEYDLDAGRAVNVEPLHYIYEEVAKLGGSSVIVTGSSMEYSNTDMACKESDDCKPATPYGRSKLAETLTAEKLSAQYNLPTRVARLFIPFGPLDETSKVVPSVIESLKNGRSVELSPCTQQRDFLYIKDVVEAYGLLAEDIVRGGFDIYNLCSGRSVTVKSVLETVTDRLGASRELLAFGKLSMRSGETEISYGNNVKSCTQLHWQPGSLEQGIEAYLHGETQGYLS